jgi:hypothetical protein
MNVKKGQTIRLKASVLQAGEANPPHVALEDSFNGIVRVEIAGDYKYPFKPINDWKTCWIETATDVGA